MGVPVRLAQTDAATGDGRGVGPVVARPPGDAQRILFELVGPDVAEDVLDLAAAWERA